MVLKDVHVTRLKGSIRQHQSSVRHEQELAANKVRVIFRSWPMPRDTGELMLKDLVLLWLPGDGLCRGKIINHGN